MRLFPLVSISRGGRQSSAYRGNPLMEPLESRQMLSVVPHAADAAVARPALADVDAPRRLRLAQQLSGTYTGTFNIDSDGTGILGRGVRRVRLDIAQENGASRVAGIITIDGLGTFDVTGRVGRRSVSLLFGTSDNISNVGRIEARLLRNGRIVRGTFTQLVGDFAIAGTVRLVRIGPSTISLARTSLDRGVLPSRDRGVLPARDNGVMGERLGLGEVLVDEFGNRIEFSTGFSARFLNGFFAMFGSFGSGFNTFGSGTGVGTLASSGSTFVSFGSGTDVGFIDGTTFNGGFNTFGSGTGVGSSFSFRIMA